MNNKYWILFCFLFCISKINAQEEPIKTKNTNLNYLEDQVYISLAYNILNKKPPSISQNGFSGGFSVGFIKDLPINNERNIGFGVGLGYAYNVYIQNLKISNNNQITLFELAQDYKSNKFTTSSVELPIEFRWRNSTPDKYKFWRVYGGVKISYLFLSKTKYIDLAETKTTKNIPEFNKIQYGFILATGYGTWNLYAYYGLKSIFKNSELTNSKLKLTNFNVGLKFYIM